MPQDMQQIITSTLQGGAYRTYDKTPNPFEEIGVQQRYATLSNGLFEEAHRKRELEPYSMAIYNTKQQKVVGFNEKTEIGFDPVVFALSVDPLERKFPFLTPYQFASNSPIQYIDMDGLEGVPTAFQAGFNSGVEKELTNMANVIYMIYQNPSIAYNAAIEIAKNPGLIIEGVKNDVDEISAKYKTGNSYLVGEASAKVFLGGAELFLGSKGTLKLSKSILKKVDDAVIRSASTGSRAAAVAALRKAWPNASLKEVVNKFAPGSKPVLNDKGTKQIFKNAETGNEIIHDVEFDYFRIKNKHGNYLDTNGKPITPPKGVEGVEAKNYTRLKSHFNNVDTTQ